MIIGNCGSGKSTLSRQIRSITSLPLIHLDKEYWKPGWVETPNDIWLEKLQGLVNNNQWIIDGNYGSSMDMRMQRAEMIIVMETSTLKSFYRVVKRQLQYWGKSRPDMAEGCVERFSLGFLHYVLIYNITRRPRNRRLTEKYSEGRILFRIQSKGDLDTLIDYLKSCNYPA